LHNNKDVLLGRFECLSAKRIVKISEALQQRSRLEFFNDLGSGELQDDVFDSADLRNFLKVPDLTGTLDKQEYDYCSVSGVGFLILNGFSFDEAALARSTSMKNSLQEFFND
jgi:hypothetical protein